MPAVIGLSRASGASKRSGTLWVGSGTRRAATGWCWRLPPCWPWPTARAARKQKPATGSPAACAGSPTALTEAQQAVLPPRRLLLRGYLWACVWLRPTPGPDFRTRLRRLDPGGT